MNNLELLDDLFTRNIIRVNRGKLFGTMVDPKPRDFNLSKIEGMLLGLAIGDSLGAPTESMVPSDRKAYYGDIKDYQRRSFSDSCKGYPTDDTQLAFWMLEQLIDDQGLVPENLAKKYASSGQIYGIGNTVRGFLRNLNAGNPWYQSGPHSAGNGAVMRIAPILIPHIMSGGEDLWVDTALASMMTHNDPASISACLAFVAILWDLLDMESTPEKDWWVNKYYKTAKDLEGETEYSPRNENLPDFKGPLWHFIKEKLPKAAKKDLSVIEAGKDWYSGAYLLETMPNVLYILMLFGNDPEKAIIRAVNDTKDNDTIGAIVGAAVGALHGKEAFPKRWINNLSGQVTGDDDGKILELIDKAEDVFWF